MKRANTTVVRPARLEDAHAMVKVMVDSFFAAHRGQMPEEAWQKRKDEWGYAESQQGWERTLREIEAGIEQSCICVAETESGEVVGVVVGFATSSSTARPLGLSEAPDCNPGNE